MRSLPDVTELLLFLRDEGASDLYVSAGAPITFRKQGQTRTLTSRKTDRSVVPTPQQARALIHELLTDPQKRRLEKHLALDFALALGEDLRFRVNVFHHERGLGAVFRYLPTDLLSFDTLGLPQSVRDLIDLDRGLVLVTGPTGCGKSTTLAALINGINQKRRCHILTVEDPIEFVHEPKRAVIHQRELGTHTPSFEAALRNGLREDPDVILVGEMRDLETISLALTAAETGHLVLSTLHTVSAAQAVDRMVQVFPESEQAQVRAGTSFSLAAVISQVLLPTVDGRRAAALEVLIATPAVRALIRAGKTEQLPSAIQTGKAHGMQSLEQSLIQLVAAGKITAEQADRHIRSRGPATGKVGAWEPERFKAVVHEAVKASERDTKRRRKE